jgi:hypothetical protein
MLNVFSFSQRKSPMVNRNTQIDDWKTTKPTSEKLGIHGSIILGLPKTEKFALMEINLKTLQTVRKSITILVRQRMAKTVIETCCWWYGIPWQTSRHRWTD